MYFKEGLLLFRHSDTLNFSIRSCSAYEQDALVMLESLNLVVNEYGEDQEVTQSALTLSGIFQRDMLFHREATAIEKDLWHYLGDSLYKYDGDGNKVSSDTMVSFNNVMQDEHVIRKAKFSKSTGSEYFMDMEFALELFKSKKES
jgi:hypothetical protein